MKYIDQEFKWRRSLIVIEHEGPNRSPMWHAAYPKNIGSWKCVGIYLKGNTPAEMNGTIFNKGCYMKIEFIACQMIPYH